MKANLVFAVGVMGDEDAIKEFMATMLEVINDRANHYAREHGVTVIPAQEAIADDGEVH
jgi:hypothetical protein